MISPTMKVLIVDNEQEVADLLKYALKKSGYWVKTVSNPVIALQLLSEGQVFDIIITDLLFYEDFLPVLSGIDFLRKIRDHNPMTQVIVITGAISINNGWNCFESGAIDFIFKPLKSMKEVIASVQEATKRINKMRSILKTIARKTINKYDVTHVHGMVAP